MNSYHLEIKDKINLELRLKRAPSIPLNFLLGTAIVMSMFPILVLIFLIIPDGNRISFGFFAVYFLILLIAYYPFRLYLWNKYGKEVFIIEKNSVIHYYDYKLFKDDRKEIKFKRLEVWFAFEEGSIFPVNQNYEGDQSLLSPIYFTLNKDMLESKIELPISDIISIGKIISKNTRR